MMIPMFMMGWSRRWTVNHLLDGMHGIELPVNGSNEADETNDDKGTRGTLESFLVFLNIGFGFFDLLNVWINWCWL